MVSLERPTLRKINIPITDTARSREFYAGLLKLPEIERPPFDFEGAWFQVGDGQIHLIGKNKNPSAIPSHPTFRTGKKVDSRDVHFAIRVKSCGELLNYLLDNGFHPNAENEIKRIKISTRPTAGFPQVYIMDPDRNTIEFNAEKVDELMLSLAEQIENGTR